MSDRYPGIAYPRTDGTEYRAQPSPHLQAPTGFTQRPAYHLETSQQAYSRTHSLPAAQTQAAQNKFPQVLYRSQTNVTVHPTDGPHHHALPPQAGGWPGYEGEKIQERYGSEPLPVASEAQTGYPGVAGAGLGYPQISVCVDQHMECRKRASQVSQTKPELDPTVRPDTPKPVPPESGKYEAENRARKKWGQVTQSGPTEGGSGEGECRHVVGIAFNTQLSLSALLPVLC
ncbi:unnamed protein product [Ostreobium quekettii]|uniref:Uncharacterized protein n=1 Tax=Ostreobium quekettii TaxID=121088 RepID=A0A8S1ILF9_9CHLO|nr:unnamed protein product [Ostreobium quekettii]